jgi:hypothetical protein
MTFGAMPLYDALGAVAGHTLRLGAGTDLMATGVGGLLHETSPGLHQRGTAEAG